MNRFVIQEIKISGFTHYEIIDTENKCKTVYTNKDYVKVIEILEQLKTNVNSKYRIIYNKYSETYTAQKYKCKFLDGCEDWDFWDIAKPEKTIEEAINNIKWLENYINKSKIKG